MADQPSGAALPQPAPQEKEATVLKITVFREDDGRFAADYETGDGREAGMGNYSATPIGALAELCATLIKVAEDKSKDAASQPAPATPDDCFSDEGMHRFRDDESVCICGEVEYTDQPVSATPEKEAMKQQVDIASDYGIDAIAVKALIRRFQRKAAANREIAAAERAEPSGIAQVIEVAEQRARVWDECAKLLSQTAERWPSVSRPASVIPEKETIVQSELRCDFLYTFENGEAVRCSLTPGHGGLHWGQRLPWQWAQESESPAPATGTKEG